MRILFYLLTFTMLTSCMVMHSTAKTELADGFYQLKSKEGSRKVFVDVDDAILSVYPIKENTKPLEVDTTGSVLTYYPKLDERSKTKIKLSQNSFDMDFMTIPVKYRFAVAEMHPQLNANVNGAVYLGLRQDAYSLSYHINPVADNLRKITHFSYSVGFFTGFGNTAMSPTVTGNAIEQEYDGVVWSRGIAAIVGVNKITIGVALGVDMLLDKNRSSWIYENKPWLGIALGLNLN